MFGIYRDSYRFAEAAARQSIVRREARSSAPTASLTELPSTRASRHDQRTRSPRALQAPPGVIAASEFDDMSSLSDNFVRNERGNETSKHPIEEEGTQTAIEGAKYKDDRMRQIANSIQRAIAEFESFESELFHDINVAKDQARTKLLVDRNSVAAIRCWKRALRLQLQSEHVNHHIERLEVKLQALHCAQRNATVVQAFGGNAVREDVSLHQWMNELQKEVDTSRDITSILDTPFVDSGLDDAALLDEIRQEESNRTQRAPLSSVGCMSPGSNATASSEHSIWC